MRNQFVSGVVLSILLSACVDSKSPSRAGFNGESPFAGVYNGQVTPEDAKIMHSTVLLEGQNYNGGFFICTGSVLSSTVILTAGHCVADSNPPSSESFLLAADKMTVLNREGDKIAVEKVIAHPMYIKSLEEYHKSLQVNIFHSGYDMALMKLKAPLPDFYRPVVLATDLNEIFSQQSFVAGFGAFEPALNSKSDGQLRHGKVRMEPNNRYFKGQVLNARYARNFSFHKQEEDSSICSGDSGGPLYYEKNGQIHQFAVNVEIRYKEGERNCAHEKEDRQVSTFLAGPHREFLANSYKELTGKELANFPALPALQDPNRFEYYKGNTKGENKNASLDLSQSVIIRAEQPEQLGVYILVPNNLSPEQNCGHEALNHYRIQKGSHGVLDGESSLSFMQIENGAVLFQYEARVLDKGREFQITVLTQDGFLNAVLPVVECP